MNFNESKNKNLLYIAFFAIVVAVAVIAFLHPLRVNAAEADDNSGYYSMYFSTVDCAPFVYTITEYTLIDCTESGYIYAMVNTGVKNSSDIPQFCLMRCPVGSDSVSTYATSYDYSFEYLSTSSGAVPQKSISHYVNNGIEFWSSESDMISSGTSLPIFSSVSSFQNYCISGDTSGQINYVPEFKESNCIYSSELGYMQNVRYWEDTQVWDDSGNKIRTSNITWDTSKDYGSDVFIQIQASNFYQKWFEDKIYERTDFVTYSDTLNYMDGLYKFPTTRPSIRWLESMNIEGFSLSTQSYGTTDLYLRLVRYNDDLKSYEVGGWVRIDIERGTSTELPTSNISTGGFDDTGNFIQDITGEGSYNQHLSQTGNENTAFTSTIDDALQGFSSFLDSVKNAIGTVPALFQTVFPFLPWWCSASLAALIAVCIILRIAGR